MKIAAYQAPLVAPGSMDALKLIRTQVKRCETQGIAILCCPEAVLGGLADYGEHPALRAIDAEAGQLESALAPLASDSVTTIVGFTELADGGRLYNSAAVFHRGSVMGVYRKLYPAIRHSVYNAGRSTPIFRVADLTFGIVICNDSNYSEPARLMADQGATVLFVPTNNGLPPARASVDLVNDTRKVDVSRAMETNMWIVRSDVTGRTGELTSYGCSGIVDPNGKVVQEARQFSEDLLVAEISTALRG